MTEEALRQENERLRRELALYQQRDRTSQEALMLLVQMVETFKFSNLHVTSAMNLREVLEEVLKLTLGLLMADNAHIFLVEDGQLALGAALRDTRPFASPSVQWRFQLAQEVLRTQTMVVVEDINLNPAYQTAHLQNATSGALLGVPLQMGGKLVGVMNFAFREARQFRQRELDTWELFAMQIAIVIENVRLYRQTQDLRRQEREYYEELNRTKDKVVDMVSHDLKNPINVINGYVHLLRKHGRVDDELGQQALAEIEHGARQMLKLVTDLLDLAKLETGLALKVEPVALNALVKEVVHDQTFAAEQKNIQLKLQLLEGADEFAIDRNRMQQALNNLVSNAIKYTPQGGQVLVRLEKLGDYVHLAVQDTGLGIPAEDISNLFNKFYRVKSKAHASVEGTGLGLAIVKEIVTQHRGRISLSSVLGQGSTFTIVLPQRSAK